MFISIKTGTINVGQKKKISTVKWNNEKKKKKESLKQKLT